MAILAASIFVVGLCGSWVAFRHIPSWYCPVYVPMEDEQDARDELGAAFTELSRGMSQGRPFEFVVRQDALNRWLVARDRIWPQSKQWIPDQIENPMVVFEAGQVFLAGTWIGPGPSCVVSLKVGLEMTGDRLRARLLGVRGGALPIPLSPIRREVDRLERDRAGRHKPLLPEGGSIGDVLNGAPLPREVPFSQPKGKFRIDALEVRSKELRVRLTPILGRAAERR